MSTVEEENPTHIQPETPPAVVTAGKRTLSLTLPAITAERLAWVALAFSAVLTRFWNLGARVASHDESLHIYYSWMLAKGSGYTHNPMMHGPLLFELTAFMNALFGANDFTSRIVPALIGIGIVVAIPLLLRPWLGRRGALATSLLLLISPYLLYFSRYNRHDIEEIAWVLLAVFAMLAYLRDRAKGAGDLALAGNEAAAENAAVAENMAAAETSAAGEKPAGFAARLLAEANLVGADRWLLLLAGAMALMFSTMETAFFYLAILASFLGVRLLLNHGFDWKAMRQAGEFDLLVVMATLGAFFSAPIALLALNPVWSRLFGQMFIPVEEFATYGVAWSTGAYGVRVWGLLAFFWLAATAVGMWWGGRRWLQFAGLFLVLTAVFFTTFFTNLNGIGTGFVGSLGYWLSQHEVQRGSQPWYYYLIVFPLYEYLPLLGGIAAGVVYALRRRKLAPRDRLFVPLLGWWAVWIFTGLTLAGEKMPWLSTHITTPLVLLAGWLVGQALDWALGEPDASGPRTRPAPGWAVAALLPLGLLLALTVRTSFITNYINYDLAAEFVDYAHGAPGVKWLMADVEKIAAATGEGDNLPVAYDSANSWPLAWYLRNHPGFYGDQPNRGALQNAPIVIAGPSNWPKVETYLGANYNRYETIRIWWPMEDYKNLTWDRIRGALADPQMRLALWDIFWKHDFTRYAGLTQQPLDPPTRWTLEDRMRIYIRKDLATSVAGGLQLQQVQMADLPPQVDQYAAKRVERAPERVLQPEGANQPRNLAFAPDGSVYLADSGNGRILHLDAQGTLLGAWGSKTPDQQQPPAPGTFNEPWGLAVDAQGNVYVADTWNHRIQKFDAGGKFLLQWGTGGVSSDGPDRFWGPRGVAIAPDGNLYITDTGNRRVVVYDPQGKFLFDFGSAGDDALNEPVGIAIVQQGQVYVADTWNSRVAIFDLQGKLLRSWPVQAWTSGTNNDKPFLALDGAGQVYLTDPEACRVLVFSGEGAPQAVFGDCGSEANNFNLPTGIAIDKQGQVWVVDAGNNRVAIYPAWK